MQLELFDRGAVEWSEDGVRYVGYYSEGRKQRSVRQREEGMYEAEDELNRLALSVGRGKYYSWTRLREKANDLLESCGVKGLYTVHIKSLDAVTDPEHKARLELSFKHDQEAIALQEKTDGMYIIQTSLDREKYSPEQIEQAYKKLQLVERAFRSIKSFLCIRPIYHYKRRRVRAHVLICFLGFYLVKKIELECRSCGITQECVPMLRDWDKLKVVSFSVAAGEHSQSEWQWSLGKIGKGIKMQIDKLGWWRSIEQHRRSLMKS